MNINYLDEIGIDQLEPEMWHRFRIQYGTRISGETLSFPLCILRAVEPGPRLAIVSGVHGDEFEGPRALWEFITQGVPIIKRGTLMVVPVANLPAYEAGTRTSPIDGINLARIFPGNAHGSPSERLAHALFTQVVIGCNLLVDLHSGGLRYLHIPLMGFYDVPGEIGQNSLVAAMASEWPFLWSAPHRDGVLSYEAIKHGIPAVGTEVGGAGRCLEQDTRIYPPTFKRFMAHLGLMDSEIEPYGNKTILDGDWYVSPRSGFLDVKVELGQSINRGDLLGLLFNEFGDTSEEIRARKPGVVVGVRSFPSINMGEWSIFVGTPRKSENI